MVSGVAGGQSRRDGPSAGWRGTSRRGATALLGAVTLTALLVPGSLAPAAAWTAPLLTSTAAAPGPTSSPVGVARAGSAAPVAPDFFGVHDDRGGPLDPDAWATGRLWAAWCTVAPTPEVDLVRSAREALRPAFRTFAASQTRRLTVSLGHPAPWVFDEHPAAVKVRAKRVWYCGQHASVTSFPRARLLRDGPLAELYAAYVEAVVQAARPYLAGDPRNRLVLQAWNEPNLANGGTVHHRIPGAARTWRQAAASLQEQERIIWRVASELVPGRFEVTSPALYGKPTDLGAAYFRQQARTRTIDSVSLNFYTLRQRKVNASLELWRTKARTAKRLVTKHRSLRFLPIWVTETNHNLVNGIPDDSNVTGRWADPAVQRRLVEVTTMEALRLRFAGLQWYQGTPAQTAVSTLPGSPAAEATKALRTELVGRMLLRCDVEDPVVTCAMSARDDEGPIWVRWSRKGRDGVEILR